MSFDLGASAKRDVVAALRNASPARTEAAATFIARRSLSTALRQSSDIPCEQAATGPGNVTGSIASAGPVARPEPLSKGMEL